MIRYSVINKISNKETNSWLSSSADSSYYEPCFGKPERWVKEGQEDISSALETRENIDPKTQESFTEYKLAAEYEIVQEDITEKIDEQTRVNEGKNRQEIGASVIAKVYAINESKNISPEVFAALIADVNLERIERMLWTGSLRTAKLMIQALDNTYFTTQEKQSILDMLTNY